MANSPRFKPDQTEFETSLEIIARHFKAEMSVERESFETYVCGNYDKVARDHNWLPSELAMVKADIAAVCDIVWGPKNG